jgi:hypothetical protein
MKEIRNMLLLWSFRSRNLVSVYIYLNLVSVAALCISLAKVTCCFLTAVLPSFEVIINSEERYVLLERETFTFTVTAK